MLLLTVFDLKFGFISKLYTTEQRGERSETGRQTIATDACG